uniref:G-protein coupled receptors family 1 profile domain-containing protein n=1 Tax=Nannospalax galili TaxID=1026970 RepID=A0A8C6QEH3_NANGA
MGKENQTSVTEFILLGLSQDPSTQVQLFLLICLLTVLENLLIILLIHMDPRLHTPMYSFLRKLSFADLCFSTTTVPQVLIHFLVRGKTISFAKCATQLVVLLLVGCTDCALLAVMSYDQYVVVCNPLHDSTFMTHWVCVHLAAGSWASGAFVSLLASSAEGRLKVFSTCGSHLIVVGLFYGSSIFAHMRDKITSLFYSAVTPMLNPTIYSLRNKDVKGALRRITEK